MLDVRGYWFVVLAACIGSASIDACEIRVRDSAFRMARDQHRFCVIADSDDESVVEIVARLQQRLDSIGDAINLEVLRVDADDPQTDWRSIGIPSRPPQLPVTVLVGRDNGIAESFVIDHWEPAPSDEQLTSLIDSPKRNELAEKLARHLAVLVVVPQDPGASSAIAGRIRSIVDRGVEGERIGLEMITIDRDDPAETLLCRFMGIRPGSPDTVCVAFGRGKLMTPPLTADQIDSENIHALLSQILQACSCSKPLQTMGVDLPLIWSDTIDSTVVLMDEELELSELDTEVQNMLAAKATAAVATQPTIIPIPAGQPDSLHSVSPTTTAGRNATFGPVALTLTALALVALPLVARGLIFKRQDD